MLSKKIRHYSLHQMIKRYLDTQKEAYSLGETHFLRGTLETAIGAELKMEKRKRVTLNWSDWDCLGGRKEWEIKKWPFSSHSRPVSLSLRHGRYMSHEHERECGPGPRRTKSMRAPSHSRLALLTVQWNPATTNVRSYHLNRWVNHGSFQQASRNFLICFR